MFFAADSPYTMNAGVDPGIISGQPAHLGSKVRLRDLETGAYFQDGWKVSRNLNLGLRPILHQVIRGAWRHYRVPIALFV
ncbi:MAG: hypothetical protein DMG88_02305 [Acidobacteria bacterium]|nr:MAG: hypothetical protein DMG88_02305 [Acidobacteriota bacterium]